MAAQTQFSTLPAELRSDIWSLTLLPSPGVYRCDPFKFIPIEVDDRERLFEVEDARWLIPKRCYPTIMHLCCESRLFALGTMEKEVKDKSFFYCIGQDMRPFIPEIDTFWFDDDATLHQFNVIRERGVIGSRVHTIQNLAVSAAVIQSCQQVSSKEDNKGITSVSNWDLYLFRGIGRFKSLQRVSVVFGPVPMETRCDGYETDRDYWAATAREQFGEPYKGQVVLTGMYDVPELRVVEETQGWGFKTTRTSAAEDKDQDRDPEVIKKMDKVRTDVYRGFERRARYLAKYPPRRGYGHEDVTILVSGQGQQQQQQQQQQQHVAEVIHQEKDLSEITFHTARMVETARFQGRMIRKSFPLWYIEDESSDAFESSSSHELEITKKRLV